MSAEAVERVVQRITVDVVRYSRYAPSEAAASARAEACSISAVGDNGVSSGDCRDDVSGDVYEETCA
jgi:hypothetical protein